MSNNKTMEEQSAQEQKIRESLSENAGKSPERIQTELIHTLIYRLQAEISTSKNINETLKRIAFEEEKRTQMYKKSCTPNLPVHNQKLDNEEKKIPEEDKIVEEKINAQFEKILKTATKKEIEMFSLFIEAAKELQIITIQSKLSEASILRLKRDCYPEEIKCPTCGNICKQTVESFMIGYAFCTNPECKEVLVTSSPKEDKQPPKRQACYSIG